MQGHRLIAVVALVAVGCAESPREAPPAERAQAVAEAPGATAAPTGPDACEDLTEARLRAALALPDTVAVAQSSRRGSFSSSCEYTWSAPGDDPQARRRAAMAQAAQAVREGRSAEAMAELARAATSATVLYVENPPDASPEAARSKFEEMMQRLHEGVTRELPAGAGGGGSFTLQSATESVADVGDAAHWSSTLHQLFVLSGPRFFQVVVRVGPEPAGDLELAKAVASAIVAAERGAEAPAPSNTPAAPNPPSAPSAPSTP